MVEIDFKEPTGFAEHFFFFVERDVFKNSISISILNLKFQNSTFKI